MVSSIICLRATSVRILYGMAVLVVALARPVAVDEASPPQIHSSAALGAGVLLRSGLPQLASPAAAPDMRTLLPTSVKPPRQGKVQAGTQLHADFWLHGVGSQLYTAWNAPVTLKAINWYGFEYAPFVPDGLDRVPLDSILFSVRHLGFNALRITFADQTVRSNPIVVQGLKANPGLRGLRALDIMGRIIQRAHHFGLRVILCNSRSEAGRGPETTTGLWYTSEYTDAMWRADWMALATRFRSESAFVGADLRNEPHLIGSGAVNVQAYFKNGPLWGAFQGKYFHDHDWHYAAQSLGNSLLSINPHLLIIVEGVQIYLSPDSKTLSGGLWGSNLTGVQYDRIDLTRQSQLVYSVHEYGPHMWQADWFNPGTTYASLAKRWTDLWGYLLQASAYLRAPIFVGEVGTCHDYWSCISDTTGWKQGFWFKSFVHYLQIHPQVGWAYWSLNPTGPFDAKAANFYSLVSADWHHYYPLVTRGLAPLLSEPDGTVNTWSKDHLQGLLPQPGCSPNRSCVQVASASTTTQGSVRPLTVKVIRDVPYVRPADAAQSGDLYVPQGTGAARRPAVVIVHGGSWDNGRKGTVGTVILAQGLAQRGYIAFDINYRLAGNGGQYPKNIQDVKDAVAYLATQANTLHLDVNKLGVVGVSAGAYLALMAGYGQNTAPFTAPHYPRMRVRIRAIGSFFAPVELKRSVLNAGQTGRVQKLALYLGATFAQNRLLYRGASPMRYSQTAVPTIFWYGTTDPMTPLDQTFELYKRLKQHTIRSQLMALPGAPANLAYLSPRTRATVVTQLFAFMADVFDRPTAWGG